MWNTLSKYKSTTNTCKNAKNIENLENNYITSVNQLLQTLRSDKINVPKYVISSHFCCVNEDKQSHNLLYKFSGDQNKNIPFFYVLIISDENFYI